MKQNKQTNQQITGKDTMKRQATVNTYKVTYRKQSKMMEDNRSYASKDASDHCSKTGEAKKPGQNQSNQKSGFNKNKGKNGNNQQNKNK